MIAESLQYSSRFKRIVEVIAGLYLLFMLVYMAARFIIRDQFWWMGLVNSFAYMLFIPLSVLFLLGLLARSRRAMLSLLPIILLIVLWFGPRFLPKTTATADTTAVLVMTNNVWRLNPTPEAVAKLVIETKPDVVFLQEVQLSSEGDALAALDTHYPYHTQLVDEIRLTMYEAVNITFSRYPFVESEKVELDSPNMPTIYRNVIEVNGKRVALYNVHLITPFTENPRLPVGDNYFAKVALGYDDTQRNQQIDSLLTYLKSERYPYIVAGDFNLSDLSMTYAAMNGQMHDSFIEAGTGLGNSWPEAAALGLPAFLPPLVRMDYIWHSAGLRAIRSWQGDFVGSDHLPLFAAFTVTP
ncbi:MAG: endonuclease/exonuclease/phosphatase family protein [Chloroflexota bacterium]